MGSPITPCVTISIQAGAAGGKPAKAESIAGTTRPVPHTERLFFDGTSDVLRLFSARRLDVFIQLNDVGLVLRHEGPFRKVHLLAAAQGGLMRENPCTGDIGGLHGIRIGRPSAEDRHQEVVGQVRMGAAVTASLDKRAVRLVFIYAPGGERLDLFRRAMHDFLEPAFKLPGGYVHQHGQFVDEYRIRTVLANVPQNGRQFLVGGHGVRGIIELDDDPADAEHLSLGDRLAGPTRQSISIPVVGLGSHVVNTRFLGGIVKRRARERVASASRTTFTRRRSGLQCGIRKDTTWPAATPCGPAWFSF